MAAIHYGAAEWPYDDFGREYRAAQQEARVLRQFPAAGRLPIEVVFVLCIAFHQQPPMSTISWQMLTIGKHAQLRQFLDTVSATRRKAPAAPNSLGTIFWQMLTLAYCRGEPATIQLAQRLLIRDQTWRVAFRSR
jgi:hypothetical protein